MNEIMLSIIVPCYNVAMDRLKQSIDSLRFIERIMNYEVWVIDDGSRDDRALRYIEGLNDPHIHAMRQENSAPGGARNTGIDICRGQYITFVDADDFIYYGPYVEVLKVLQAEQPEILAHGYSSRYEGSATAFMLEHDVLPTCWSYIIRRSLLSELRFTPHIYHEDEEFITKLHLLRAHLITLPIHAYYYRYEAESIMHKKDPKHVLKRFDDYITVMQHLQALQLPATHELALERRLDIMAMCFVLTMMRDFSSMTEYKTQLNRLRDIGLYPLPLHWRGFRYYIIALITRFPAMCSVLSPIVKLIFKIQDAPAEKRAFASHADIDDAD